MDPEFPDPSPIKKHKIDSDVSDPLKKQKKVESDEDNESDSMCDEDVESDGTNVEDDDTPSPYDKGVDTPKAYDEFNRLPGHVFLPYAVRPVEDQEQLWKEYDRYFKQIRDSDGFDYDPAAFPSQPCYCRISTLKKDKYPDLWESAEDCLAYAIDQYNKKRQQMVKLHEIVKVTFGVGNGIRYYITFKAANFSNEAKTYQTMVHHTAVEKMNIYCFRLKPTENAK